MTSCFLCTNFKLLLLFFIKLLHFSNMSKINIQLYLIIFICTIPLFGVYAQENSDKQKIKECFARYKESIFSNNGKVSVSCVDNNTLEYNEKILSYVITADSASLQKLEFYERLTVLTYRLKIPHEELLKMDGPMLYKYIVDNGLAGRHTLSITEIGTVALHNNFAKAQIIERGTPQQLHFHFHKEGKEWKIDLTSVLATSGEALKTMIAQSGKSETEMLLEILTMTYGKKPDSSIWKPLK